MKKTFRNFATALLGITVGVNSSITVKADDGAPRTHILAIGVSDYLHNQASRHGDQPLQDLNYAAKDALSIAEVFQSHGLGEEDITLLSDESSPELQPNHENVIRKLNEVSQKNTDTLIIMFFGHGVELEGNSHLCLSDSKITRSGTKYQIERGLSVQQLSDLLATAKAKTKVILTDACRNLNTEDQNVDVSQVANYDIGKHLKELNKDQQVGQHYILSSCLPNQIAIEPEELEHGLFAYYLIEGLKGKCDYDRGNRDGEVSLQELFYYAARQTSRYALEKLGRKQMPWIQLGGAEEIVVARLNETAKSSLENQFRFVSFDSKAFSHEQQMALEQYSMALEAFGLLDIGNCIALLNNVIAAMPNHTEAVRLLALCYTLNGQEIKAIQELKKLSRNLKAKVYTSNSNYLGVRDAANVQQSLMPLSSGDVIEIVNFSGAGTKSTGEAIPEGAFLYVSRIQKQGIGDWVDVNGVVFSEAIKPTTVEQVIQNIQDSQRQFGNTRIQSDEEIRSKAITSSRGLVYTPVTGTRIERAMELTNDGLSLANSIRSGDAVGITSSAIDILAPKAAPKVHEAINTYNRVRSFIPF